MLNCFITTVVVFLATNALNILIALGCFDEQNLGTTGLDPLYKWTHESKTEKLTLKFHVRQIVRVIHTLIQRCIWSIGGSNFVQGLVTACV